MKNQDEFCCFWEIEFMLFRHGQTMYARGRGEEGRTAG